MTKAKWPEAFTSLKESTLGGAGLAADSHGLAYSRIGRINKKEKEG
jgi:hypothetical protein